MAGFLGGMVGGLGALKKTQGGQMAKTGGAAGAKMSPKGSKMAGKMMAVKQKLGGRKLGRY